MQRDQLRNQHLLCQSIIGILVSLNIIKKAVAVAAVHRQAVVVRHRAAVAAHGVAVRQVLITIIGIDIIIITITMVTAEMLDGIMDITITTIVDIIIIIAVMVGMDVDC